MRKILFLDIDGVLNNLGRALYINLINEYPTGDPIYKEGSFVREGWRGGDFSLDTLGCLAHIVEETKCEIVITSTWRLGSTLDELKALFPPIIGEKVIDKTELLSVTSPVHKDVEGDPVRLSVARGREIDMWMKVNNVSNYGPDTIAILDDDLDMHPYLSYLVNTDAHVGLTYHKAEEVIKLLNKKDRGE